MVYSLQVERLKIIYPPETQIATTPAVFILRYLVCLVALLSLLTASLSYLVVLCFLLLLLFLSGSVRLPNKGAIPVHINVLKLLLPALAWVLMGLFPKEGPQRPHPMVLVGFKVKIMDLSLSDGAQVVV